MRGAGAGHVLGCNQRCDRGRGILQQGSVGIQPPAQKILVAKAVMAHRAAYAPFAKHTIEVDTPGLTTVNPARYTYRHVRPALGGLGR